ncbi:MAG: hypothetical protein ACREM3_12050 [Candidatus Rokuibacteriota bacterium]
MTLPALERRRFALVVITNFGVGPGETVEAIPAKHHCSAYRGPTSPPLLLGLPPEA